LTDAAGIGAELRAAREALGLGIGQVAQQLKFAPRQLEALEEERFDELPGGTFARGMVRSYARLLKLDPEPLVRRIGRRFEAPEVGQLAARYSQPVPFSDSGRRSTLVYLGLSLGVLLLGGGVAYEWHQAVRGKAPQQAAAKQAPAREPARVAAAQSRTPAPSPAAEPQAKELPAPAKVAEARPAPVKAAEKTVETKFAAGVHRLVISCEEEAWIEVKDANDRMLVSSLNPKGAERVVQARGPLAIVIGNAQHVRLVHNDRLVDLQPYTKSATARLTLP
jgi:cytoskeleton protein RodZ